MASAKRLRDTKQLALIDAEAHSQFNWGEKFKKYAMPSKDKFYNTFNSNLMVKHKKNVCLQIELSGAGVLVVKGAVTAEVEIEKTNHGNFIIGKLKTGLGLSIGLAFFYASLYMQAEVHIVIKLPETVDSIWGGIKWVAGTMYKEFKERSGMKSVTDDFGETLNVKRLVQRSEEDFSGWHNDYLTAYFSHSVCQRLSEDTPMFIPRIGAFAVKSCVVEENFGMKAMKGHVDNPGDIKQTKNWVLCPSPKELKKVGPITDIKPDAADPSNTKYTLFKHKGTYSRNEHWRVFAKTLTHRMRKVGSEVVVVPAGEIFLATLHQSLHIESLSEIIGHRFHTRSFFEFLVHRTRYPFDAAPN
jgi:hypothetical protein